MIIWLKILLRWRENISSVTLDYGDIDEDYYCVIEGWFEHAGMFVQECRNAKMDVEELNDRLLSVMESTGDIGWGVSRYSFRNGIPIFGIINIELELQEITF